MKSFTRGLVLALLSLSMLGVTGCGPDNEAEALKAQKIEKDPGTIDSKSKTVTPPPPARTQQEQYEQQQKSNAMSKTGGYPGAKK
ncbi:MAG: hypothetical protein ACHRXM_01555 [Isosphaerales bacterium]